MVSVWKYETTFAVRDLFVKIETYVSTSEVVSEVEIIISKNRWKFNFLGKNEKHFKNLSLAESYGLCVKGVRASTNLQSGSSASSKSFKAAHGQMWSIDEFKLVAACQLKHYLKWKLKCKTSEILNPNISQCSFFRYLAEKWWKKWGWKVSCCFLGVKCKNRLRRVKGFSSAIPKLLKHVYHQI